MKQQADLKQKFFKRIAQFALKHWYVFPLIKLTIVSTLFITLAEDGLINPLTSNYVCHQMSEPFCYAVLPSGQWVLHSQYSRNAFASQRDLHGWMRAKKSLVEKSFSAV